MRLLRITIVAAAALAAVVPLPAAAIERVYARGFYPRLQAAVTFVSSLVPIALLDVAVALLAAVAILFVVRSWRAHGAAATLRQSAIALVVAAAAIYLWFLLFWGLNYRRLPLEDKLAFDRGRITRDHAMKLGRLAVDQANALAPAMKGAGADDRSLSQAFAEVDARLAGGTAATLVAAPKRSLLTRYFRVAAIDGMTDPFFLEVILHPDLLPFERPFVIAHEWAHLAGYADESEANFVAWLTCVRASPPARYSGWLSAYQHVAAGLPREDRRALRAALSPPVVADLTAASQRLARSSPRVRTAARGAYDSYLRANRIEEGIANYDAVVRLMLGTSMDAEWRPVLR